MGDVQRFAKRIVILTDLEHSWTSDVRDLTIIALLAARVKDQKQGEMLRPRGSGPKTGSRRMSLSHID